MGILVHKESFDGFGVPNMKLGLYSMSAFVHMHMGDKRLVVF